MFIIFFSGKVWEEGSAESRLFLEPFLGLFWSPEIEGLSVGDGSSDQSPDFLWKDLEGPEGQTRVQTSNFGDQKWAKKGKNIIINIIINKHGEIKISIY